LGHVAAEVGNTTGNIFAPGIMADIPGTELHSALQNSATRKQINEDAEALAKVNKPGAEPTYKPLDHPMIHPSTGLPEQAFYNEKDPNDIKFKGDFIEKPSEHTDDQNAWVNQALKDRKLPDTADNRKDLITEYSSAHQAPTLVEHKNPDGSITYEAAKAGTTVAAPEGKIGSTVAESNKFKGKTLYFDTPEGRQAYTAEEAKAQGLDPTQGVIENEGQVAKDREKNSTYNVISKALSQYQQDMAKANITPADQQVLMSMTHEAENPDYISKLISGVFDAAFGHPVTGYSEKLMKGTLDKNQYQDMSPAARQLVADYYTTMMAHFANMKASQGTIPRNPVIIQTEMHTIPQPYLSPDEAKPAFQNYLDQVGMRNSDNVKFTPKGEGNKTEEKKAEPPAVGFIEDGHKFLGGDPSKPESWARVGAPQ
jgi:hypothetical protein